MNSNTSRFQAVIGHAALNLWPRLPRGVQEALFEHAVGEDEHLRQQLAMVFTRCLPLSAHQSRS